MANLRNDYPHFIPNEPMDLTDELRAFVAVAQNGSFTEAGRQLGLSNRLVSKYVAALETRLGMRLFQRTTRRVGLSPAGQDLLARAPAVLEGLDDLLGDLRAQSQGFSGQIRLSASVTFGEARLAPALGRFQRQHPDLRLDLRLEDSFTDLAAQGVDLAIRLGDPGMPSLRARKLGQFRLRLLASPDYLAAHGAPTRPEELAAHACIIDTNRRDSHHWRFARDGQDLRVRVNGPVRVNSAPAAAALAVQGLGLCYCPDFALQDQIATGQLVELLPEAALPAVPINAVYLEGRPLARKLRALIEHIAADLRQCGNGAPG